MELKELESWLLEGANILRGPVDQADYKAYIFPLLFLKRISDVWDEEYGNAMKEYGEDYEDEHRFIIPEGCNWDNIRRATTDIGKKLKTAMKGIETQNTNELYGIFGDTQWTNKEKLSDELLTNLIEHFSRYNLSNNNVKSNTMGDAYEFLIKKFADLSNKKAGEFYTPRSVVKLMNMILNSKEGESIYDPACGTGGMLIEALEHIKEIGGDPRTLRLYGNEKNLTTSAIARMNLLLHGLDKDFFEIIRTDTLKEPRFLENDKLKKFDVVIANPPFSLKKWGSDEWENDKYGRNIGITPSDSNGDYAWILHMINSLKENGRMAVVLPQGVLFRKAKEGKIRKWLLENDLIECIIGLAPNLFYGTNIAASIIVLKKNKDILKKGKVQFINASEIFRKDKSQNYLEPKHIDDIFKLYNSFNAKVGKIKIASHDEIKENDWSLHIPLYIEPILEDDGITLERAYTDMVKAFEESSEADERLSKILKEMEID